MGCSYRESPVAKTEKARCAGKKEGKKENANNFRFASRCKVVEHCMGIPRKTSTGCSCNYGTGNKAVATPNVTRYYALFTLATLSCLFQRRYEYTRSTDIRPMFDRDFFYKVFQQVWVRV